MEFDIRVQPKAGRNCVEIDGDKVTARVTAAPEDGKANDAVVALLAKRLSGRQVSPQLGALAEDHANTADVANAVLPRDAALNLVVPQSVEAHLTPLLLN